MLRLRETKDLPTLLKIFTQITGFDCQRSIYQQGNYWGIVNNKIIYADTPRQYYSPYFVLRNSWAENLACWTARYIRETQYPYLPVDSMLKHYDAWRLRNAIRYYEDYTESALSVMSWGKHLLNLTRHLKIETDKEYIGVVLTRQLFVLLRASRLTVNLSHIKGNHFFIWLNNRYEQWGIDINPVDRKTNELAYPLRVVLPQEASKLQHLFVLSFREKIQSLGIKDPIDFLKKLEDIHPGPIYYNDFISSV